MTNSTKLIGLIMTAALWAGVAAAQGLESSWGEDAPPELTLPSSSMRGGGPMATMQPSPGDESLPAPQGFAVPQVEGDSFASECEYPDASGLWNQVAPIESTGTWLQRGFWYAEAYAVVFNRVWDRKDKLLAAQDITVNQPFFFLGTNRLLVLDSTQPGEDAAVRLTLGHFLFRDSRNRDHTGEFTVFGGGDWEQQRVISSTPAFGLFVPFAIDGGNTSFDNSTRQTVGYKSRFNSFEANYRVRQRLGHDRLVMDANGAWHRAANAGFDREFVTGLRFVQLEENLDWRAEDIAVVGADGRYLIQTDNRLYGYQFGGGATYQAPRWSMGAIGKAGIYVNDASGRNQLDFTASNTNDSDLLFHENELSFLGEFKLQGRFHVTPNASLRAAYELMFITSIALAPSQANFIPQFAELNTNGDPFYQGVSFGIEGYW